MIKEIYFESSEITDVAILAKVDRYREIVHRAAHENRDFTAEELKVGTRILRELIEDNVYAWWDQGFESFVKDLGPIFSGEKNEV